MSVKGISTPKYSRLKTNVYHFSTAAPEYSDSEESNSECGEKGALTIVALFDEIVRLLRIQRHNEVENAFIEYVEQVEDMRKELLTTRTECIRLQHLVDDKTNILSDLETKLNFARKLVDQERKIRRKVEEEKYDLEVQIIRVKEIFGKEQYTSLPQDTKEKLSFLNNICGSSKWDPNLSGHADARLSAIPENNTTGSLLSDFSYSRSEDDLDCSMVHGGKTWKKFRPSVEATTEQPATKKRRSSNKVVEIANTDSVRATTTINVPKNGPITATSIIESIPLSEVDGNVPPQQTNQELQTNNIIYDMWQNSPKGPTGNIKTSKLREHSFQTKTIVMPDMCAPCEKRIRFGKTALRCKDCRVTCHPECKHLLPLPCVPYVNTPTQRNLLGLISDYTPTTSPMVPALIAQCVNEIESRELTEMGLYRIPGSEREVKQLKEKFLRGKGSPCLNQCDIHVLCGTIKDFLRSLHEPLVTYKLWPEFVKCLDVGSENITAAFYQIISQLPQPNRDTLAFIIVHLKKVAEAKECKMPVSNLSKVFGPTIVGYSCIDPKHENMFNETRLQTMVMEYLLNLSNDYWSSFLNVNIQTPRLQQTPSTDSLLRSGNTGFSFTPHLTRSATKRKQKFFASPLG